MKINWKSKLSSRKFWALLAALAVSICTAFGVIPATTENIVAIIGALGACAVYMLSEAYVDGKSAGADVYVDEAYTFEDVTPDGSDADENT